MSRVGKLRHGIVAAFLAFILCVTSSGTWAATARPSSPHETGGVAWFQDLYEAHKISVATGRPLLIVFGAPWCHYCKELESTTLQDPRLVAYISANFVPVHIDADHDKRLVEILVKSNQIPCTVILSPDAELLGRVFGYLEVQPFARELETARQRYLNAISRRR